MPSHFVRMALLGVIRVYQKTISPFLPRSCRFYPTCSQYAYQAVEKYGAVRGGWKAAKRVARCHPLSPGGYDPLD